MNEEELERRTDLHIALAQCAGALLVTLFGAWLIWSGVTRWMAGSSLRHAVLLHHAGDIDEARNAGRDARAWLPQHPLAVLLASSASSAQLPGELAALRPRDATEREAISVALAIHALLHGAPIVEGGLPAVDAAWLKTAAAAQQGVVGMPPEVNGTPFAATLRAALPILLNAAWEQGHREAIRAYAGMLRLTCGAHPQRQELVLVTAALDTSADPRVVQTALGQLRTSKRRDALTQRLLAIVPERSGVLSQQQGPAAAPRPIDSSALFSAAVARAATLTDEDRLHLINALVDANRGDLAEIVAGQLTPSTQALGMQQVHVAKGDLAELLASGKPEHQPTVTAPRSVGSGFAACHIATPSGGIPNQLPAVLQDGNPLPPSRVQRLGSLLVIDTKLPGQTARLAISIGARTLFDADVKL